ncbi:MAG: DUF6599 family protein [Terriglobia bacterium]
MENGITSYSRSTLSDYSPGNAAIYLEYGFNSLSAQELRSGPDKVQVELAEMIDAPAAYGVFTFLRSSRSSPVPGLKLNAEGTTNGLNLQKGKYYIRLTCISGEGHCVSRLTELAELIANPLSDSTILPEVIRKLPREDRIPRSETFLMGTAALDRFLPLKGKDPFGLNVGAEAAFAKYAVGKQSANLLLIEYPNQQLAKQFLEAGYDEYVTQYPGQPIYFKRDGPLVTLVFETTSPDIATSLLEKIGYVSTVVFYTKVQPPNIARVLLNIFIYCGILLAITLAAGILFGIFRVVVKRFFPGKVFDRDITAKVLRLDIDIEQSRKHGEPSSTYHGSD